jgi:hypothetical protein
MPAPCETCHDLLDVESEGNDAITVRLVAKSGERLDESEIDACLQHTVAKTQD